MTLDHETSFTTLVSEGSAVAVLGAILTLSQQHLDVGSGECSPGPWLFTCSVSDALYSHSVGEKHPVRLE